MLINDMLELARGTQGDINKPTLAGLAAPQLGVGKRIIVVDVTADGSGMNRHDFRVYINPKLVTSSKDRVVGREGCFSTGCVCGRVWRARQVRIEAIDGNGQLISERHELFTARIFQHEIDHLDGVRFPDRIERDENLLWVDKEDFGTFRRNWETWSRICPRECWEAIKNGKPYHPK